MDIAHDTTMLLCNGIIISQEIVCNNTKCSLLT